MLYFTRTSEGATLVADEERLLKGLIPIVPAEIALMFDLCPSGGWGNYS